MVSDSVNSSGLHLQRRGRKSVKQQDRIVELVARNGGLTAVQVAWKLAGFEVDANGHCLPADLFRKVVLFGGYQKRASEIAFKRERLADHPRAKLVYGKALINPYTDGGASGLYLISGGVDVNTVSIDVPEPEQVAMTAADALAICSQFDLGDE